MQIAASVATPCYYSANVFSKRYKYVFVQIMVFIALVFQAVQVYPSFVGAMADALSIILL